MILRVIHTRRGRSAKGATTISAHQPGLDGQVDLPWDDDLSDAGNHNAAAMAILKLRGALYQGEWTSGQLNDTDRVYVHEDGPGFRTIRRQRNG